MSPTLEQCIAHSAFCTFNKYALTLTYVNCIAFFCQLIELNLIQPIDTCFFFIRIPLQFIFGSSTWNCSLFILIIFIFIAACGNAHSTYKQLCEEEKWRVTTMRRKHLAVYSNLQICRTKWNWFEFGLAPDWITTPHTQNSAKSNVVLLCRKNKNNIQFLYHKYTIKMKVRWQALFHRNQTI